MEQYISKSALIEELDKRRDKNTRNKLNLAAAFEDNYLLSFLNTLEVKEVDLEKEYDNEFFKDPVFGKLVNRNAGISIAKHFFELGLKSQKGE